MKIKPILGILVLTLGSISIPIKNVDAKSCKNIEIIFARGSGGSQEEDDENYKEFKKPIEEKLKETNLTYKSTNLNYPAIAIGLDNLKTTIETYTGHGDQYEFGDSVNEGVSNLISYINNSPCKETKYVLGGYSQGAMVISKSLPSLDPNKIIYAATFGDPKIYLPEGQGIYPDACKGKNLSDYRAYVPECHTYEGLLGSYRPYEPNGFSGKLGTWCNKSDIMCSNRLSITDHLNYISDSLYEDASKIIFDKITQTFNIKNNFTSKNDTAILIDSTSSMEDLINSYKQEALRLAKETINSGGRVALYEYRDLGDPFEPVMHCGFETCTIDKFETELDTINVFAGGDPKESLLSASFTVMKEQKWNFGATKSLVVLTDAGYLNPDRDGIKFEDVVNLSKTIDPVNFYIITPEPEEYKDLAKETDGMIFSDLDKLHLSTDYIINRYDSLPKVEESTEKIEKSNLEIESITNTNNIEISYKTNADKVLVVLNGMIIGFSENNKITLENLDWTKENQLKLIPYKNGYRGETTKINLNFYQNENIIEIGVPNTGKK